MKVDGRSIGVLGAGALGLTAALRLAQRGAAVTVLEREPLAGGLASGFQPAPGIWLERFYHHLSRSDRHAISLIREIGLGDRLTWHRPLTSTLYHGRRYQLDSPSSLLRFSPLSLPDRLRMGMALALLRGLPTASVLERRTAAGWLRSMMGGRGYEVVWQPLFRSKFGAAADEIALPWFWARVHDRSAQLGYISGGFQLFYERLQKLLEERGAQVRLGTEVTSISRAASGIAVAMHDQAGTRELTFDAVLSTLPTRLTCRLTPELPQSYRERHDWPRAYGAHCLILGLERQLTDAYWLNVNDPGFPFMAVVEHTNMRTTDEYSGLHLLYLANYRSMEDPIFAASRDELLANVDEPLRRLNPSFESAWIKAAWVHAAPFAQPIVTVDYRARIPPFDTPLPNLFVANMFQVYPHDRGQNYSIELAERVVRHIGNTSG